MPNRLRLYTRKLIKSLKSWPSAYWRRGFWQKFVCILTAVVILFVGAMYSAYVYYSQSVKDQPMKWGVSFVPDYAQSLGVDPQANLDSLLGIGVKHLRLVSYWSDMEQTPGNYDFSQLDWQFKKAEAHGAKISLAVGLRQPRWPECHAPNWVDINQPDSQWEPQLEQFIQKVVDRYKNSPSLESYQLENEYMLHGFGICTNFDRQRLVREYNLVKQADPHHIVIVSRSNNALGIPIGQPTPDGYAISVYKRVWDARITHRYLEYPPPAWFYGALAGLQKLHDGRDMIIHEMQAEAWAPNNKSLTEISLAEQNKSLNAHRLDQRFDYAQDTGMREAYLWGSEYWYYRLTVLHDPSLWQVAKEHFNAQ
jgi:hypothetical protein